MKYKVTFKEQREVAVIVDIDDEGLNKEFARLGEVESDKDFKDSDDPRWGIEQAAYEALSSCDDNVEYGDFEEIVDRSIEAITD